MKIPILLPFISLFSITLTHAQWQPNGATSGNIYYNGGNVGIGTDNPGRALDVNGIAQSRYFFANAPNTAYTGLQIKDDNGLQWAVIKQNKTNPDFRIVRYKNGTYLGDVLYAEHDNGNLHIVGGDVGIGTTSTDAKLTVKGDIHAEEVRVDLNVPAPDYVFAEDYDLPSLESISAYIKANQHLPEVPSAEEMEEMELIWG